MMGFDKATLLVTIMELSACSLCSMEYDFYRIKKMKGKTAFDLSLLRELLGKKLLRKRHFTKCKKNNKKATKKPTDFEKAHKKLHIFSRCYVIFFYIIR